MVGQWFTIRDPNGDGVMISTDGGNSWKDHNWNMGAAEAHYGSFSSFFYLQLIHNIVINSLSIMNLLIT